MSLTVEERLDRLEKLFVLNFGSLDYEEQRIKLLALHAKSDKISEKLDEISKKREDYLKSPEHQEFLKSRDDLKKLREELMRE